SSASPPYTFTSSPYSYTTLVALGGPPGSIANPDYRQIWIDVNGDGLPDIYDPSGHIWINTGGPAGSVIFQSRPLTVPSLNSNRTRFQFAMDIDGDGRPELLIPNTRIYAACYNELIQGEWTEICGAQFDGAFQSHAQDDKSIFSWDAYKFVEAADGSYSMVKVIDGAATTSLLLPTRVDVLQNDSNGDGSTDLYYQIYDVPGSDEYLTDPPTGVGPYITRNLMRAPDLMTSASNGLGATATWKHRPLSNTANAIDPVRDYNSYVGCD